MFYFEMDIICPFEKTIIPIKFPEFKVYYQQKYDICKYQDPKTVVEIGVRAGYSALVFLQACPEASYLGIDFETYDEGENSTKWAKRLLKPYNFEIWKLNTLSMVSIEKKNIDFFHIDGDHSAEGVFHDLDLAFECISDKGLILCDDFDLKEVGIGIRKWLRRHDHEVNYEYITSRQGELLIRKVGNYDRFYKIK